MPEALLPLPDLSMDRIILVHALEMVQAPEALLRECWRVLRDDGRLIVVVPNRLGAWSLFDHTPFGQGRPWSRGQLWRLLEGRLFRVAQMRPALFAPPLPWPWALTGAAIWEGMGRVALPRLSGVVMAEAVKDVLGAVPLGEGASRMVRMPPLHGVVKQL
jgi:SAM-dependent methyltransferase